MEDQARSDDLALTTPEGQVLSPKDARHRLFVQTLTEAQVDFLLQRTPKHEIKVRQGRGGLQFSYVEHGYVTERLNMVFGFNWDFEVVDKQMLDDEVIVEAKLTVRTPSGQTIVKTQFGGAEIKRHISGPRSGRALSIADDYKAAASDALKKCASLLGVGLDLYGRDGIEGVAAEEGASPQPSAPSPEHVDRGPEPREARGARAGRGRIVSVNEAPSKQDEPCTRVQLDELERLAGAARMRLEDLCENLGVGLLSELSRGRAERVIRRLRQLAP